MAKRVCQIAVGAVDRKSQRFPLSEIGWSDAHRHAERIVRERQGGYALANLECAGGSLRVYQCQLDPELETGRGSDPVLCEVSSSFERINMPPIAGRRRKQRRRK